MRAFSVFVLLLGTITSQCQNFANIGSPVNSISEFFSQMFKGLDPDNSQSSPRIVRVDSSVSQGKDIYKIVMEVKNEMKNSKSFIGVVASHSKESPGSPFKILKFIMTTDFFDLQSVVGMKDLKLDGGVFCKEVKKVFMDYFLKKNYDLAKKVYDYNFGSFVPSYSYEVQALNDSKASTPQQNSNLSPKNERQSENSLFSSSTTTSSKVSSSDSVLFATVVNSLGVDLQTGRKPNGQALTTAEFHEVAAKLLKLKNTKLSLSQVSFVEGLIDKISKSLVKNKSVGNSKFRLLQVVGRLKKAKLQDEKRVQ